jgi:hypothetical protein
MVGLRGPNGFDFECLVFAGHSASVLPARGVWHLQLRRVGGLLASGRENVRVGVIFLA